MDRHSLLIEPAPTSQIAFDDYFGNGASILTIDDEHSEFVIHARSTVEVSAPDLPMLALSTPWEQVVGKAVRATATLDVDVLQFVERLARTRRSCARRSTTRVPRSRRTGRCWRRPTT